jgi:uncharacterized protein involved in exopolysaccharide biosynthesis
MNNDNKILNKDGQEDSFDLVGLLFDYLSHWKWFVVCILIAAGYGFYYISTITPMYEVSASIFLSDENTANSNAVSTREESSFILSGLESPDFE